MLTGVRVMQISAPSLLQAQSLKLPHPLLCSFDDEIVEAPAKTTVSCDNYQGNLLDWPNLCERNVHICKRG